MIQIPFNDEFEKAVLVGVLQDPLLLHKVQPILEPYDFYKETNREIYEAILSVGPENLDSLTVQEKLSGPAQEYFKTLVEDSDKLLPSLSNIIYYAEIIKGKSKLRAGIDLGREITALCYTPNTDAEEALQSLEEMFASFLQKRVLDNKLLSTQAAFRDFVKSLGHTIEDTSGTKTGFIDVDLILHKLEGLIIVAARPSMGKTAYAVNIARNVAENKSVLFFSVEQSQTQIFQRMLAAEAEVSLEHIRTGAFINDKNETERIKEAEKSLIDIFSRLHVEERADIPTSFISSVARQKKYEWGNLGLIVVDYLHILRLNSNKQTTDSIGDAVKELRALGKELECPVLLLSQLSRANEQRTEGRVKNRRPELVDLRGSGDIEQSADVVMFLYRDSYYQHTNSDVDIAEVIIKKNRNGRTGVISLEWCPQFVKFKNPSTRLRA